MDIDEPGKGEARMEPVDVDVLDNLINAQAAYLEAISSAFDHVDYSHHEVIQALQLLDQTFCATHGRILSAMAARRI